MIDDDVFIVLKVGLLIVMVMNDSRLSVMIPIPRTVKLMNRCPSVTNPKLQRKKRFKGNRHERKGPGNVRKGSPDPKRWTGSMCLSFINFLKILFLKQTTRLNNLTKLLLGTFLK
jgi:hypothetical protein